jgi:hypothetical protein
MELVPLDHVDTIVSQMTSLTVERDADTYQHLITLYMMHGMNPRPLWDDMMKNAIMPSNAAVLHKMATAFPDGDVILELLQRMAESSTITPQMALVWINFVTSDHSIPPRFLVAMVLSLEQICRQSNQNLSEIVLVTTWRNMEKKCWQFRDIETFDALLEFFKKYGFVKEDPGCSFPVEMATTLLSCGMLQRGIQILETMNNYDPECLAAELLSPELVDQAYYMLEARRDKSETVKLATFHVIILACSMMGDEQRAVETLESLPSFNLVPTAVTFGYVLQACGYLHNRARNTEAVIESMSTLGVVPTEAVVNLAVQQLLTYDQITTALRIVRTCAMKFKVYPSEERMADLIYGCLRLKDEHEAKVLATELLSWGKRLTDQLSKRLGLQS